MSKNMVEGLAPPVCIANRYDVVHKISEGSFGQVYLGVDSSSGARVAIKVEPLKSKSKQLMHEVDVYRGLQRGRGIPDLLWSGISGEYNAMVLDLLGPDLDELFDFCGRRFSDKTILQFGLRALELLEHIHRSGFIYRDMKPQNFLVGLGDVESSDIYVLDFGLTKALQAVRKKKSRGLVGTARYASISAHRGDPPSFRDDVESLGYILIYFGRGSLPWSGLKAKTTKAKYALIANKKMDVPLKDLCAGHDQGYAQFIQYCRNLRPSEQIDYNALKRMLMDIAKRTNVAIDGQFDWMEPQFDSRGQPKVFPNPTDGPLRIKSSKKKSKAAAKQPPNKEHKDDSRKRDASRNESKYNKFNRERKRRPSQRLRSAKTKLSAAKAFADYPTVPETSTASDVGEKRQQDKAGGDARSRRYSAKSKGARGDGVEGSNGKAGEGKDNIIVSEKNAPGCTIL